MHGHMPQEIEVWYVLPALRRELAKSMLNDYNLSQKKIAKIMGLTEAAVSQYLHSKRAKEVVFSNAILEEVRKSAKKILEDNNLLLQEMIRLTKLTEVKHVMCDLHRKHDGAIPEECEICFEENPIKIK